MSSDEQKQPVLRSSGRSSCKKELLQKGAPGAHTPEAPDTLIIQIKLNHSSPTGYRSIGTSSVV